MFPGSRWPFCGGTLISDRHVLTAAHCTKGTAANRVEVIIGDHDWTDSTTGRAVGVKCIQVHTRYNSNTLDYDFSLLSLNENVLIALEHQPACLPYPNGFRDNRIKRKSLTVSGWGALSEHGGGPDILHSVNVPFVTLQQCRTLYRKDGINVTPNMMCAGNVRNGGIDACFGDSGGIWPTVPIIIFGISLNIILFKHYAQ